MLLLGLSDEAGHCVTCPAGHACINGEHVPCPKFLSYSLPGDIRCRRCPPGYECLDVGGLPSPCKEGEYIEELSDPGESDYQRSERRCKPCPTGRFCPKPYTALVPSMGYHVREDSAAVLEPSKECHTYLTDKRCPPGGVCFKGSFFHCPP